MRTRFFQALGLGYVTGHGNGRATLLGDRLGPLLRRGLVQVEDGQVRAGPRQRGSERSTEHTAAARDNNTTVNQAERLGHVPTSLQERAQVPAEVLLQPAIVCLLILLQNSEQSLTEAETPIGALAGENGAESHVTHLAGVPLIHNIW